MEVALDENGCLVFIQGFHRPRLKRFYNLILCYRIVSRHPAHWQPQRPHRFRRAEPKLIGLSDPVCAPENGLELLSHLGRPLPRHKGSFVGGLRRSPLSLAPDGEWAGDQTDASRREPSPLWTGMISGLPIVEIRHESQCVKSVEQNWQTT